MDWRYMAGDFYIEVNYEEECNGIKKTLFIDDYNVMDKELWDQGSPYKKR